MKKTNKFKIIFFSVIIISIGQIALANDNKSLKVVDLRCEYLHNPLGLDVEKPRFSWIIKSKSRAVEQQAYRIIVAGSQIDLKNPKSLLWDSGVIQSSCSVNVDYDGPALKSRSDYFWQVKICDNQGHESEWSQPAFFHTGFMSGDQFKGKWIASPDVKNRSPLFRKEFNSAKKLKSAYLYVTAIGIYKLFINSQNVEDRICEPNITQFEESVLYSTYDVTKYIRKGKNAIGLWLGEGMAAFTKPPNERFANKLKQEGPYQKPMMLIQLDLTYEDGSQTAIISDTTWRSANSPLIYNNFFGGEDYDARLEQKGWNLPDFNDNHWKPVSIENYNRKVSSQMLPPSRTKETIEPISSVSPQKGVILYDLGTTIGGSWGIELKGKCGTEIIIKGSEKYSPGNCQKNLSQRNAEVDWDRSQHSGKNYAKGAYSKYILKGDGIERYRPLFFFTGFRYVQVEINEPEAVEVMRLIGYSAYNDLEQKSDFKCSNELLNQIHQNVVRTIKNTFIGGIPLSNPHSEKYGWTGNLHLVTDAVNNNFFAPAFWTKWLNDFKDEFQRLGYVPFVVPELRSIKAKASAAWGYEYPALVWNVYSYYNDKRILNVHYDNLIKWHEVLTKGAKNYIIGGRYGDHNLAGTKGTLINTTPILRLLNTAYYYQTTGVLLKIAKVLQKKEDIIKYQQEMAKIKDAYHKKFFNKSKKYYFENEPPKENFIFAHTVNLVPLQMGLIPDQYRKDVVAFVIEDIKKRGNKFYTGILGTKALLDVFQEEGYYELLYHLINSKEYPGWGYQITKGATSLWQTWDGRGGDFNHLMFGGVDSFFYGCLLGIKPDYIKRHVTIQPFIPEDMTFATGKIQTIYGEIAVDWKKIDTALELKVAVPHNMSGRIVIPITFKKENIIVSEGKYEIWRNNKFIKGVPGIFTGIMKNNHLEFETGSGVYHFKVFVK